MKDHRTPATGLSAAKIPGLGHDVFIGPDACSFFYPFGCGLCTFGVMTKPRCFVQPFFLVVDM